MVIPFEAVHQTANKHRAKLLLLQDFVTPLQPFASKCSKYLLVHLCIVKIVVTLEPFA